MFKNPERHFLRDFPEFQPPQTFPLKFFWFGPRGVTGFPSFPPKEITNTWVPSAESGWPQQHLGTAVGVSRQNHKVGPPKKHLEGRRGP